MTFASPDVSQLGMGPGTKVPSVDPTLASAPGFRIRLAVVGSEPPSDAPPVAGVLGLLLEQAVIHTIGMTAAVRNMQTSIFILTARIPRARPFWIASMASDF